MRKCLTMCTSCDETYKIFSLELMTKEPVSNNMELYREIAHRLFQHKVISNINIDNNKAFTCSDKQKFGFDLHLGNKKDPQAVNLINVENALTGLLDNFEGYSEMQIKLNECA